MEWVSQWDNGHARSWGHEVDPDDPWLDCAGSASYAADGEGILTVTGTGPRCHVHNPDLSTQWLGALEATLYWRRVTDDETAYGGLEWCLRTNHGTTGDEDEDLCDTRNYGARLRHDGKVDFEKEYSHPSSSARSNRTISNYDAGTGVWWGMKFVIHDTPEGYPHLEQFLDVSDGANGGTWVKINEVIDDGTVWAEGQTACGVGTTSAAYLSGLATRDGSESSLPNISARFRNDGGSELEAWYKKASLRQVIWTPHLLG